MWQDDPSRWPVTTLPALEAVQAAKEQGLAASEELDRALRVAFFGRSRCISLRSVILEVAGECESVDVDRLREALDDGRARRAVMEQHAAASSDGSGVKGSPHLFLPDGTDVHNPGVDLRWEGRARQGLPGGHRRRSRGLHRAPPAGRGPRRLSPRPDRQTRLRPMPSEKRPGGVGSAPNDG